MSTTTKKQAQQKIAKHSNTYYRYYQNKPRTQQTTATHNTAYNKQNHSKPQKHVYINMTYTKIELVKQTANTNH